MIDFTRTILRVISAFPEEDVEDMPYALVRLFKDWEESPTDDLVPKEDSRLTPGEADPVLPEQE